jgi:small subunit ribosomal protein S17
MAEKASKAKESVKVEPEVEPEAEAAAPPAENEGILTTVSKNAGNRGNVELAEYLKGRRTEIGRVVSDKMTSTVVVSVERSKPHPLYHKVMRRSIKFMAHDELGSREGDTVRIIESRPMSAHKRWKVVEIIQKAERV